MTTFLDFFEGRQRPAVCGHRGHSVDGLENSFAALTAARERGADLCEIDVRLTADGEMIVFHDAVLDDTSTASGAVRDWVWSDLKTVHHKARDKGTVLEPIRLVKDILAHALVTDLRLVVELKDQMSEEALDQLAMLLGACGMAERVIVSSFDHRQILALKTRHRHLPTFAIAHARFVDALDVARRARADAFSLDLDYYCAHNARALREAGVLTSLFIPTRQEFERAGSTGEGRRTAVIEAIRSGDVSILGCDDVGFAADLVNEALAVPAP